MAGRLSFCRRGQVPEAVEGTQTLPEGLTTKTVTFTKRILAVRMERLKKLELPPRVGFASFTTLSCLNFQKASCLQENHTGD